MKAVIKIAHRAFLFPNAKKAADVLAMLSDAMEMESKHVKLGSRKEYRFVECFFPDANPSSLSMEIVTDEQLRSNDPNLDDDNFDVPGTAQPLVITRKRLPAPKRLLLSGGAQ